jgi:nitrite reductase/ring-hydroxylating ferredoxin subunit/uncharacterized membrane protein
MPWLDGAAAVLRAVGEPIAGSTAPRRLKDALVGTWYGLPLHPAVVIAPIGFWTSSVALDIAGEERAADLTLSLGLVSATGAAVTGIAQWQDAATNLKPRRLGALHASLNTVATGIFVGSLVARRTGARSTGRALSLLGYAVAGASAHLGGNLSYDLGIGVDHAAFDAPPTDWTDVIAVADLPDGQPINVDAAGVDVFLLRRGATISAIGNTCPHLGGPLHKGEVDGDCIRCPWHDSVFRLDDGSLVHGPATTPVDAYEVRVVNGRVSIRVDDTAARQNAAMQSG